MTTKEAPPDGRTPWLVTAVGSGVTRNRRWAKPEKFGGAKSRGCSADLTAGPGVRHAGRTAIGKLWETAGHKGWTFPTGGPRKLHRKAVGTLWDGSPPAGYSLDSSNLSEL